MLGPCTLVAGLMRSSGCRGIVRTAMWLWIGASALETVAVHFSVPWPWVRWTLMVMSLWRLVWIVGFLAGLIVYPHLIEPDRVRSQRSHDRCGRSDSTIDLVRTYAAAMTRLRERTSASEIAESSEPAPRLQRETPRWPLWTRPGAR